MRSRLLCHAFAVALSGSSLVAAAQAPVAVGITIADKTSGARMPARVHLKDPSGKPHQPQGLPFWRDHFVCDGATKVSLLPGTYTIEVERGPEYSAHRSTFAVRENTQTNIAVTLEPIANLAAEGWWSGELHVHRPPQEAELLMSAEDLHVAQFITWWNKQNILSSIALANPIQFDGNRFAHLLAGEDEREGGALLYFNLKQPLAIASATRHFPSSLVYAGQARKIPGACIDMEKPFWWDFPLWLASGLCDSVGLANNHMQRSGMLDNEAWGKPRDRGKFSSPRGNGFWTQEIYYHALNCGLRIPPSAGSASGVLPNPVGYNRVYVHLGPELGYGKWWEGLRAGRSFVSNGPLLRCRANGKWPGEIFSAPEGGMIEIEIEAMLNGRDSVPALEVVRNGRVVRSVPIEANGQRASMGKVTFTESGWFLVRAIADEPKTFRFASTAPFYVEVGRNKQRISKASAQFFLDWVKEGMERVQLPAGEQREAVLKFHRDAERFWQQKLTAANTPGSLATPVID